MKQENIIVNIQSFSDIITNSSSEIFCSANNKEYFKDFLNNVLKLIDPDIKFEELFEIDTIVSIDNIIKILEDYDLKLFWNDYNIDKDYLLNALNFSSSSNLIPINKFLEQYDLNYNEFCNIISNIVENETDYTYISEFQYIIVPIKQNVDMTLIYKINEILEEFPHRTYYILESYN